MNIVSGELLRNPPYMLQKGKSRKILQQIQFFGNPAKWGAEKYG